MGLKGTDIEKIFNFLKKEFPEKMDGKTLEDLAESCGTIYLDYDEDDGFLVAVSYW